MSLFTVFFDQKRIPKLPKANSNHIWVLTASLLLQNYNVNNVFKAWCFKFHAMFSFPLVPSLTRDILQPFLQCDWICHLCCMAHCLKVFIRLHSVNKVSIKLHYLHYYNARCAWMFVLPAAISDKCSHIRTYKFVIAIESYAISKSFIRFHRCAVTFYSIVHWMLFEFASNFPRALCDTLDFDPFHILCVPFKKLPIVLVSIQFQCYPMLRICNITFPNDFIGISKIVLFILFFKCSCSFVNPRSKYYSSPCPI